MYDELRAFCLFMGYTRSGHSLVGACLDAHPEAAIAHEAKIFEYDDNKPTGGLHYASRPEPDRSARQPRGPARAGRDDAGPG